MASQKKPAALLWEHYRRYRRAALKTGTLQSDTRSAESHFLAGAATCILALDRLYRYGTIGDLDRFFAEVVAESDEHQRVAAAAAKQAFLELLQKPPSARLQ